MAQEPQVTKAQLEAQLKDLQKVSQEQLDELMKAKEKLDELLQENEALAKEKSVAVEQLKEANEANRELLAKVKELKENQVVVANVTKAAEPKEVKKVGPGGRFEIKKF